MNLTALTRNAEDLKPALAGSALLHLTVAALFLIAWPWSRELKVGAVVPVKIVTNAPTTDVRPAVQAPEAQTAAAPEPEPDASLQAPAPPAPEPAVKPAPPAPAATTAPASPAAKAAPASKPAPAAAKAPAKPQAPAKSAAATADHPDVDLDKLLASVSKSLRPSGGGAARSSAPRAAAPRPETAPQARPAIGSGLAANAMAGLSDELQRRWNPNCEVEGGRDVQVRVTFTVGANGLVVGDVTAGGEERSPNPVVQAAAERAIRAVHAAAPFRTLPREYYGERIAVRFNAREACALG